MADGSAIMTGSPATTNLEALMVSEALVRAGSISSEPVSPLDWRDLGAGLVQQAGNQRLTGLVHGAVTAGRVVLSDGDRQLLFDLHLAALVWCLQLEDRLCSVADRLGEEGIVDLRVIKGSAIAHLDEVDPAMRTFSDIDILVRGEDLARTCAVAAEMGADRPYPERRPGFDRRFAKSVTVSFLDGMELDIHRTLCDGVHAVRLPVDRLFENPETFVLAGREFAGLDETARLLHTAYHAVLGSPEPRLMSLRDLLGYLIRTDDRVGLVAAEAHRWGGTAVLATAVAAVLDLPGANNASPLARWRAWLDAVEVPDNERAIVAAQRRDGSSYGPSRLRVVRELATWSDRWAYGLGVLVPTADHLRARGLTRRSMFGRPSRTLRRRADGRADP